MPVDALIYATTDVSLTEHDLEGLNRDLMNQVGADRFSGPNGVELWIVPAVDHPLHCDELPDATTLLRVRTMTAYYGPNCERGDWTELAAILEFIRRRIPAARVWYGDDSNGAVSEITDQWMSAMWGHWAMHGNRPYYGMQQD